MKSHKYWSLGALFFIALYGHVHLFWSQTGFSKEEKNNQTK